MWERLIVFQIATTLDLRTGSMTLMDRVDEKSPEREGILVPYWIVGHWNWIHGAWPHPSLRHKLNPGDRNLVPIHVRGPWRGESDNCYLKRYVKFKEFSELMKMFLLEIRIYIHLEKNMH